MAIRNDVLDPTTARLITPVEAANRLGVRVCTLAAWRLRRRGPHYITVSRSCVRYRESDIDAWVAAHRVEHDGTGLIPATRTP